MLSDKFFQVAFHNGLVTSAMSAAHRGTADPAEHVSRSDSTMDAIKTYMIKHQLKPGDPLPTEAALCSQLGVSRSSVREALRQLEALDIVKVRRGKGSSVGDMTMQPLIETLLLRNALATEQGNETISNITTTRMALDVGVAPVLVKAMKGTSNPDLRTILDRMLAKTSRGELFPDEDLAFHQGLLSRLNNEVIVELMSSMWFVHQALMSNLDLESASANKMLTRTAQSHVDILDAAEAGDLDAYMAAQERHYQPLQNLIAQELQENCR